ncbi:secretin N-terminal domain-containing protein [Candidatus Omnitrophota bacterium]
MLNTISAILSKRMRFLRVGVLIIFILVTTLPNISLAQAPVVTANGNGSKLSLDIKGMDVLDVFRLLSMRGGLNIVAGKNVTGKVTLFLKDVEVWDAFEIIIAANDLAFEKRTNIIYVMTQRDYELNYGKKYEDKRIVKSLKLKHAKATDISKAISQLKTNIGRVIADEASDTLIVMDVAEVVADMEKVIEGLDIPLITKVYSLQYASAESLKDKLGEMLTKNVGSLRMDERTNKIAITDLKDKMPVFDKVIDAFDEKHKEVLIEAKILQITLNDDYRMGINWDGIFATMRSNLHRIATVGVNLKYSNQSDVIPTPASAVTGGALQIGQLDTEGYQAVIQALKEYGQSNLLSSPRIVALNNEEAKILVGTNQPYATRSISQTSGGAANIEAENVTFLDLGVKLFVTPTINEDGFITMKIKPEVSSKTSDFTIQSSGNTIPVVKTTTTETTVMVKDGKSILIGGLIEENVQEHEREVPGLGRIPLLGSLFRSRTTGSGDSSPEKTELVIFLTPHIITGDSSKELLTTKDVAHQMAMEQIESQDRVDEEIVDDIITDNLFPQQYYDIISTMITQEVENHRPSTPISGEVVVSFILDSEGNLVSKPKVYYGQNKDLESIGIESVQKVAPFPPFPKSINKETEIFQIGISYE